jgi:alanyl-tRNA synthetase
VILGETTDGKSVFSGERAFLLKDTHGLDLGFIADELKNKNMIVDVEGFVSSAVKAGWTLKKIKCEVFNGLQVPETAETNSKIEYLYAKRNPLAKGQG